MKIFKPVGSKDRFFDMFQKINKVQLNEIFDSNNNSIVNNVFEQIKNKLINIKNSETQTVGDKTFVVLTGADNNNNVSKLTFEVSSQESDQDNVFNVGDTLLKEFSYKGSDGQGFDMDENDLKEFNRQHGGEFFDIIDKYIDVESKGIGNEESDDELYEDAIKKIDSYKTTKLEEMDLNPTIGMQTGKAYSDNEPVNSELRVSAEELEKYVNEMEDDNIINQEINRFKQETKPDNISQEPINNIIDEPVDDVSEEKKEIILKAYNNVIQKSGNPNYAPTMVEVTAEIEKMLNKPVQKKKERVYPTFAEPYIEEEKKKKTNDYPEAMGKEFSTKSDYPEKKKKYSKKVKIGEEITNESIDIDKYENIVFLQGDEAYDALERLNREGKDAALEYLKQWHYPGEHEGTSELGHGSGDQIYEKDGYIMSWNSQIGYIGLQFDLSKMNEPILKENNGDDIIEIFVENHPYYLKKAGDSTHFYMSNNLESLNNDTALVSHIGEHNGRPYYNDIRSWLKGGESPNGKKYNGWNDDLSEEEELEPEENPETTPESNNDKIKQLAQDKKEQGEVFIGGKGDNKSPLDFNPDQVIKGLEVEKEHTNDPLVAIEVVLDHLSENPDYYTVKDTPEDSAQAEAAKDAEKNKNNYDPANPDKDMGSPAEFAKNFNNDDSEMTDILLGYKPKNVGDEMNTVQESENDIKQKDPATWHQIQIAKKTLKMSDAMVGVMGGMNKEQAKEILAKYNINVNENIIGASGAVSPVGNSNNQGTNNQNNELYKKYQDYKNKDIDTLSDDQKGEFFILWNQFKGK